VIQFASKQTIVCKVRGVLTSYCAVKYCTNGFYGRTIAGTEISFAADARTSRRMMLSRHCQAVRSRSSRLRQPERQKNNAQSFYSKSRLQPDFTQLPPRKVYRQYIIFFVVEISSPTLPRHNVQLSARPSTAVPHRPLHTSVRRLSTAAYSIRYSAFFLAVGDAGSAHSVHGPSLWPARRFGTLYQTA